MPSMRARIVAVNGVPAERVQATADTQWALRGDRGLTYAAAPPPGTRIVAGQLVGRPTTTAPPLVSFDAGLASGWGVGIGDVIRVNVLGRDIDLRVASLRDIAWQSLALNFAMVASPGLLQHAPHTHIATVRVAGPDQGGLLRARDRRAAQRHRHPGGGRARRGRGAARPGRRGAGRHRIADPDRRRRWCWSARSPPASAAAPRRR